MIELFLNELSVVYANSEKEADFWVRSFVGNCISVKKYKNDIALSSSYNSFAQIFLFSNYNFFQSFNKLDKTTRDFFISIATRTPNLTKPLTIISNPQFKFDELECVGLAYAYINDSISISFPSESKWDSDMIEINICEYIEENDEIQYYIDKVKHISKAEHIEHHNNWIMKSQENELKDKISNLSGKELWDNRKLFTNLIFCKSVENQLTYFNSNSDVLKQIKHKLINLNRCFDEIKNNPRDIYYLIENYCGKFTRESETRINQFKERFTFKCPDNQSRLFSYHLRYTPNAGRIHINIDINLNKCFIGYIGKKII